MSLLRTREYWRWSAGVQLARLPSTMAPLAFTLLTTAITGSYRLGAVMMAVFVVAELLGAIPAGRVLDRIGPAKGLIMLLTCAGLALGAIAIAASAGLPGPVLLVLVVLPGSITGGLTGGFRTLLSGTIPDSLLPRAVAVDAMILEGVLIAGPLLVSAFSLAGWLVPLGAMAVAYLASATLVPRARMPHQVAARERLPVAAAIRWLACQFAVGHLLSTMEVAPLPLVQRLGAGPGAAGFVIAVLSGASILGSGLYAWRTPSFPPARQAIALLCGFIVGGCVVAADLGWPGLLGGAALIGVCTGPLVTVASVQLQRLLPEGRRSEGFSLSFAVQGTGFGLGSLSIGVLPLWAAPLLGVVSSAVTCAMLALLTSTEVACTGGEAERPDMQADRVRVSRKMQESPDDSCGAETGHDAGNLRLTEPRD